MTILLEPYWNGIWRSYRGVYRLTPSEERYNRSKQIALLCEKPGIYPEEGDLLLIDGVCYTIKNIDSDKPLAKVNRDITLFVDVEGIERKHMKRCLCLTPDGDFIQVGFYPESEKEFWKRVGCMVQDPIPGERFAIRHSGAEKGKHNLAASLWAQKPIYGYAYIVKVNDKGTILGMSKKDMRRAME